MLVGYIVFFLFGWGLWKHQSLLDGLTKYARIQVAVAVLLMPINVAAAVKLGPNATQRDLLVASITGGVVVWLLVFGITGVAIRFARHERPWMRYLTDASYWMYLLHVPLMFLVPGLLAQTQLPALLKLTIVFAIVVPILLFTYHWFVRATAIGALLNGRRYAVKSFMPGPAAPQVAQAGD